MASIGTITSSLPVVGGTATVSIATTAVAGVVKPDINGATTTVAADGTLSAPGVNSNATAITALSSTLNSSISAFTAGINIKGTWNASTNSPALSNSGGGGIHGDTYFIGTAGTTSIDGNASWSLNDQIVNTGSLWIRLPASTIYAPAANPTFTVGTTSPLYALSSGDVSGQSITPITAAYGPAAWGVQDASGNYPLYVDKVGNSHISNAYATAITLPTSDVVQSGNLTTPDLAWWISDANGNIAFAIGVFGNTFTQNVTSANLSSSGTSTLNIANIATATIGSLSTTMSYILSSTGDAWQSISGIPVPDLAWWISDANGNIAFAIDVNGVVIANNINVLGTFSSNNTVVTTFAATEIAARDGQATAQSMTVRDESNAAIVRPTKKYNGSLGYGQSFIPGTAGTPLVSTTQPFDSLMIGGQVHGVYGVAGATTFTPITNSALTPLIAVNLEQPSISMVNTWRKMQLQTRCIDLDSSRLILAGDVGIGGQTIEALSKGASPELFGQLRSYVTQALAAAQGAGGTYCLASMFYMQGEANYVGGLAMGETPGTYTASGYSALLLQLYSDMCNDLVTTILGQARLPPMFVTQTSSGWDTGGLDQSTIGMGQLNACLQNPNIYMAGPYYQMPDDPGGSQHLTGDGYAWLGSQVGKVMHKVIDSGQGWLPLYPTSVLYRGNQILVTFHVPEPPLVFDTPYVVTTLTDFAAKGFNVYDADGSHSISSVSIVGSSTVLITVASPINGTLSPMLQYAGKATFSGTGCLRDSDPTMSDTVSSLTGLQFHLANWCVGFNLPITAG